MKRELEARRLSRRTDPHTSHEAAAKVDTFRAGHEAKIFSALSDNPHGLTYREIADMTGMEPVAVGRRLKGMERRKLIWRAITQAADTEFGDYEARNGMAVWRKA